MIALPAGTRIWIAAGVTDLRRGFTGLSGMVQTALQENPFSGHVFVFRGRRGDLIKMLWWDGDGENRGIFNAPHSPKRGHREPRAYLPCLFAWQRAHRVIRFVIVSLPSRLLDFK